MYKYAIDGRLYTIKELADKHGIKEDTLRFRLRQGYPIEECIKDVPIHESVSEFCNASYWRDWIGKTIDKVYEIYWKWAMVNDYNPLSKVAFGRQLKRMYPIKTVAGKDGRIIRHA